VISCAPGAVEAVLAQAAEHVVAGVTVGETGGSRLRIDHALDLGLEVLRAAWDPET
jgi:hypothetical protein